MKKLLIALSLLLAGCMGGEDDEGNSPQTISPGTYNTEFESGAFPNEKRMTVEYHFEANGNYRCRVFVREGTQSCLILDGSAKWSGSSTHYITTATTLQVRGACSEGFADYPVPADTTKLRNVTGQSFEEYTEFDNQPAQWIRYDKI